MRAALCLSISLLFVLAHCGHAAASATVDPWAPGVAYAIGALAAEDSVAYRCLQAHTSQAGWEPHSSPALWLATDATDAAVPSSAATPCWAAWDAAVAYIAGANVSYEAVNYRAAWWTQGAVPPTNTGVGLPWVAVSACGDAAESAAPTTAPAATAAPPPPPAPSAAAPTAPTAAKPSAGTPAPSAAAPASCTPLHVAADIDLCLPPVVCTAETCPPSLGSCINGQCQYKAGYSGLQTFPEAWSTYYCTLSTGGCHGVSQVNYPEVTADKIAQSMSLPLCESVNDDAAALCIGIAASSPMVVGNSQVATDPATGGTVAAWGMGLTEASGLCYSISGPGGSAIVALTDRCGGYCKCGGSGFQECGPCVSAADMEPNCPCVGTVLAEECCGMGCKTLEQECDWCASNNHPHFDLDTGTFAHVCGPTSVLGSCRLTKVTPVACMTPDPAWPPGGNKGSGGHGATCPSNQFVCDGVPPDPAQPVVPGTNCCCGWGLTPQSDGSCQ